VTAAVAAGQTPPTALWAAGGAVSGALIGLLVPAPGSKKAHEEAAATATALARSETTAAADLTQAAEAHAAVRPAAEKVKAEAARAVAKEATAQASAHKAAAAETPETKGATVGLAVLFVVLLVLSVVLASGLIAPAAEFVPSLKSLTTALVALASASGSALIGILAPSPGKAK
jgi:cobalamin biosynthesis Mg chelatase CobN